MQHQGEGGRRWRRGRKLKSQNLERKEDRRKRWRRRSERASPVERQVGRYERRWGVGRWRVLESRQAGGGGDVQEETHQQRGFEFQSSSKMMSFSQKKSISFHQNKPVKKKKTAKKKKRPALGVCLLVPFCPSRAVLFFSVSAVSFL